MTRNRSRQAETESVNQRMLRRGAVKRQHIGRWAIGSTELAPGVVLDVHLGPQIINEGNLTPGVIEMFRLGETITVEATFEVPVDGALIEWDTLIAQRGFPAVTLPTTTLEVSKDNAYYDLAEVELSWDDDWARFATVEARVNGTAMRTWTAQRGGATVPFTVPLSVRTPGDLVSIFLDHGDAAPHTITARATLQLIDGAGDAAPTPDVVLLTYEATGWSYLLGANDHSPGFEAPAFDDSGWSIGQSAFGGGNTVYTDGIVIPAANTVLVMTTSNDLCLRREFTPPRSGDVVLEIGAAIDDFATIWLNGVEILPRTPGGMGFSTLTDAVVEQVEANLLPGVNVLAVRHEETSAGSGNYFDMRLTLKGSG